MRHSKMKNAELHIYPTYWRGHTTDSTVFSLVWRLQPGTTGNRPQFPSALQKMKYWSESTYNTLFKNSTTWSRSGRVTRGLAIKYWLVTFETGAKNGQNTSFGPLLTDPLRIRQACEQFWLVAKFLQIIKMYNSIAQFQLVFSQFLIIWQVLTNMPWKPWLPRPS